MNTEEQAKAKWCPFGNRAVQNVPSSANRDDGDNPVTFCIASECMAWRWQIDYKGGYAGVRWGFYGLVGRGNGYAS